MSLWLLLAGCQLPTQNETDNSNNDTAVVEDSDGDLVADKDMDEPDVVIDIKGVNFSFSVTEIEVNEWDIVRINFASDDGFHDRVVDEFDAATEQVRPGTPTSVTFVADKAWTYEYYCSVGQHRANGMVGKLTVKARDAMANAKDALSDSPRHQEWVEINHDGKTLYTRVVYPQVSTPAPVVLVIHENKGLTDWVRQMADDIAAEWYIAVAPDLLSSFSDDKKRTADFATEDDATQALYTLDASGVMNDLQAVYAYANTLDAGNGKMASVWFCWWWSQSFRYATANPDLDVAFVFYGTAPEEETVYSYIQAPVLAFYGGDDERINATIEQTQSYMDQYDKPYNYEIYDGAGHAFMRRAVEDNPSQANIDARAQAFARMLEELKKLE